MSPTLDFGTSASGQNIPTNADATAIVMGKPSNPLEVAGQICKALLVGQAAPVNWLAATLKVAPGGRDPKEIAPELLEGTKPYKPQTDMFGIV